MLWAAGHEHVDDVAKSELVWHIVVGFTVVVHPVLNVCLSLLFLTWELEVVHE